MRLNKNNITTTALVINEKSRKKKQNRLKSRRTYFKTPDHTTFFVSYTYIKSHMRKPQSILEVNRAVTAMPLYNALFL